MTSSYLFDPDWPPARIDALINHLGAKTQTALADRLGVAQETVNRWCQGHQKPSASLKKQLSRIARKSGFEEKGK